MIKLTVIFVLLFAPFVSNAQVTIYSQNFGDGSSLPAGWTVTAGTSPGFAASSVYTSSGYTDPNASGGGNLLADDNASLPPFEYQEIVLNNSISTVGYTNITVKWGAMSSNPSGGFPGLTFEWSTDGFTWNPVTYTEINFDGTWQTISEITLPVGAEEAANIQFRFSFTSTTAGDVYALDDFRVNGLSLSNFYSKATGNLDDVNNWGQNPDGSGAAPLDFTSDGKTYNIRNNATPTITGNWVVSGIGSKVVVKGTTPSNFTIPSGFSFTGNIDVESGATLTIENATIPTLGTISATSTVVFGAAAAQSIPAASYGNLTVSSTGTATVTHSLGASILVGGALTVTSPARLGIGANTLTLNGTVAGSGTITGSATSNMTIGGTGALGTITFTGGSVRLLNFTINRTSSGTVTLGAGLLTVSGTLTLTNGTLYANSGLSLTSTVSQASGTISYSAGTPTVGYNQTSNGQYVASGTYYSLFFSNFNKTLSGSGTISIFNTFTKGTASGHSVAGSTINFNGTGAQTIPAFSFDNLTISNARTTNNITLASSSTITIAGIFNPTATFTSGTYVVTGSTVDFNGSVSQTIPAFNYNNLAASNTNAIVLASSGTIGIGTTSGIFTPGTAAYTVAGSTIDFKGSGAQTIPAFNYNNLTSSSTGGRTLAASGTVGVAGTFTPGTNVYTITGSTVDFNGSGGQGIPAFNYNNLTSSSTGARTLAAAGTIGIAEVFTPGTNAYTNTGSTIDFNGSVAQGIPAFNYNHLTSSSTGGRTLAAAGTIGIAGTFTPGTNVYTITGSTVNFNGTSAQSIPAFAFNNLQQNNAAGVSITGAVTLAGVMTIGAGTFTTTGQTFTLLSTAAPLATASIDAIPAGASIVGNITMQRYTPASMNSNDWRFLCAPVSGATILNAWEDDFATSGFPNATCGSEDCANPGCSSVCSYPSIYWYDETQLGNLDAFGFTAPLDISDPIVAGRGYWVYIGPSPVTFEVSGAPYQQVQSLEVSYNASVPPNSDDDGWCLVANPYPATIDWDAATDATHWTKTNLGDEIHVYNSSTGTYADYSTSMGGVNGGTRYIASQQAFWVKADGVGAPVLTARELVKATAQNPTYFKMKSNPNTSYYPMAFKDFPVPFNTNTKPDVLKLTARGAGHADEILVGFKQGASSSYDSKFDARKLINPNTDVHNFSSVMPNGRDLSINANGPLTSDVSIPLRLTIPTCSCTATYSISRDSVLMLPLSACIVLEDTKTGAMIDLRSTITYSFTISDTTAAPRFILHISAPLEKEAIAATCSNSSNGKAIAKGMGAGPWNYTWKNSAGTVVKTTMGSSTADTLQNCVSDTYSVTVTGGSCGAVSDTIVVLSPPVLASTTAQTNVSCFNGNNGAVSATPYGGSPSYTYQWGGGQTTSAVSNLTAGVQTFTVTDSKGCIATASVIVSQPAVLASPVSQTNVLCNGQNNGSALAFVTGGTPAYSYAWSNGQSSVSATGLVMGNYALTVTDAKGCTSTSSVSISQPALLTHTVSHTNVTCFGDKNGTASVVLSGGTAPFSFIWNNGMTTSSVSGLAAGFYSFNVLDGNGCSGTASVTVTQPGAITPAFTASSYTVDIAVGSDVTFTNGSTGGVTYQWNFGDGSPLISGLNATHTYTATGTYIATVIVTNGACSIATSKTIVVVDSNPTALTQSDYESMIKVGYEDGEVYLLFSLTSETKVNISVYNMLGEEILVKNDLVVKIQKVKLDFPPAALGVYIAVCEMMDALVSRKIVIPVR